MANIDNLSSADSELEDMVADTPVDTKFLTYIRQIEMGDSIGYAVCSEDGAQLAVFASQEAAFFSARQHNLVPMQVH